MKKFLTVILSCFILFSIFNISAFANSAQVFIETTANIESFILDYNSPIKVSNEILTFDFSNADTSNLHHTGVVSAEYTMQNTSSEEYSSTMIFPFISNAQSISDNVPTVKVNNKEIESEIIFTGYNHDLSSKGLTGEVLFNSILNNTSEVDRIITEYTVDFTLEEDFERYSVEVFFLADNSSRVITSENTTGYSGDGENHSFRLSFDNNDAKQFVFFSYGDIDILEIKATSDDEEFLNFEYEISKSQIPITKVYDMALEIHNINLLDNNQVYHVLEDELFYSLTYHEMQIAHISELIYPLIEDSLLAIKYTADFKANESLPITISYTAKTGYDDINFNNTTYPIVYLLTPAASFQSFDRIDIYILTNEETPFVVNSNLQFAKMNDHTYFFTENSLPDTNLEFSLSSSESVQESKTYTEYIPIILVLGIIFGVIFIKNYKK